MCGRYALVLTGQIKELPFVEESSQLELELPWECYNIAPTLKVPILDSDGGLKPSTWGFIPHWSKTPPKSPLINARAETAAVKPSFRVAFKGHHCAVPTSGFFEWTGSAKDRIPYFIGPAQGELLWLAGLASSWTGPEGQKLLSHAILTRSSENTVLESLHDRCPVSLEESKVRAWIKGEAELDELACSTLFAHPYRVSKAVNKAANDSPTNLQAVEED